MSDLYDPNAGGVGFLTWDQFDRLRSAVHNAHQYIPWLRVAGYLKSGTDPDEHRTRIARSHMPLGLPATWLAAEEISSLLQEIRRWPNLEDVAKHASEFGMSLVREVETAQVKWPLYERSREVRHFRCPACQQMSLRYYPPTIVGERLLDSVVRCTTTHCRAIVDELMFTRMALLIEAEQKEAHEQARRLASGRGSASKGGPVKEDRLSMDSARESKDDATGEDSLAVLA